MNGTYNPHVKSYPNLKYPEMLTPYKPLDYSLGALLVLCSLVGIPGNVLGAMFFSSKTRKDLVTTLYIVICSIDSITCLAHLPVAGGLFTDRVPGLFNLHIFCVIWEILFSVLQKVSIYLVLLLSISRTIAIAKPFYKVRSKGVVGSLVAYIAFLSVFPVLQYCIPALRGEFKYSWDGAYCYYNYRLEFEHVLNLVLVGCPPIITFVTLLMSICKLHYSAKVSAARGPVSRRPNSPIVREMGRYRASITIAMFTSLFLVCNLPLFVNLVHNMTTSYLGVDYPGVYFSTRLMFWYSWHVAKVTSVVVNACLNPVLYYCRMKRFRSWVNKVVRGRPITTDDINETYTHTHTPRMSTTVTGRFSQFHAVCSAFKKKFKIIKTVAPERRISEVKSQPLHRYSRAVHHGNHWHDNANGLKNATILSDTASIKTNTTNV